MKTVLTGYRPTGKLHLGHLHGNLKNMLQLQEKFHCYFFVADWHALTTDYANTNQLQEYTKEMIIDWLSIGLDPKKSVIYRQSDLPEIAEISLYFSMITPLAWLERNPTYKEQQQELKNKDISTYGFLGYPVLQAADILSVRADFVPVGEDQLPHLELAREIARRFNHFYGSYLNEPQAILSKVKRLPGIDGRKMSKSYGNAIFLSDDEATVVKKVMKMITDPEKIYKGDPGHPDICTVYAFHKIYSPEAVEEIAAECRSGRLGCVKDKQDLAARINLALSEFRKIRQSLAQSPEKVDRVLKDGAAKAGLVVRETLSEIRKLVKID
jgi:tryptophanyl-tRNA synthetase